MAKFSTAFLLLAALAVAGCNNPGRFGAGTDGTGTGTGFGAGGVTTGGLGDPNNPTSPAYFDQHTLSAEARQTLSGQAQWLVANAGYSLIVEGHADEQGTREYNIALSDRRANSARDFLVSQGVAASRIRTIPYGKERPVEVC